MNLIYSSIILGGIIYIISYSICKLIKLPDSGSKFISLVLTFVIPFYFGEKIKSSIGLTDSEITITEMVKPVKVYDDLEVSDLKLNKIYSSVDKIMGNKIYIIEYSVNIKNNGEPIITIDDPNGNQPVGFNEDLVLRNLDGVEGKDEYLNFTDIENSELLGGTGEKLVYSTINPIKTNDSFTCIGKIVLDKEDLNNLVSRKYDSYLYIRFGGTTKEKYNEPNGYGFVIKQDEYKIDLTSFLSSNSSLLNNLK